MANPILAVRQATYLCLLAVVSSASGAEPLSRQESEQLLREELTAIADICDQQKMPREAAITRQWLPTRAAGRQIIFTPTPRKDRLVPADSATVNVKNWYAAFLSRRRQHAERLFDLAKAKAQAGEETAAIQPASRVATAGPEEPASAECAGLCTS